MTWGATNNSFSSKLFQKYYHSDNIFLLGCYLYTYTPSPRQRDIPLLRRRDIPLFRGRNWPCSFCLIDLLRIRACQRVHVVKAVVQTLSLFYYFKNSFTENALAVWWNTKQKYDIMLTNVISDVYFLFLRPVHIVPSSLSSATIDVANSCY